MQDASDEPTTKRRKTKRAPRLSFSLNNERSQAIQGLADERGISATTAAIQMIDFGLKHAMWNSRLSGPFDKALDQIMTRLDALHSEPNSSGIGRSSAPIAGPTETTDTALHRIEHFAIGSMRLSALALGFAHRVWMAAPGATPELSKSLFREFEELFLKPEIALARAAAKKTQTADKL